MSLLDEWVEAATTEVLLPSGMWVRWRSPDNEQIVRRGLGNKQLRLAVLTSGGDPKKLRDAISDGGDEVLDEIAQATDELIVNCVRAVRKDGGEWETVTLTTERLHDLPPDDVDALRRIVNGMPAEQVTILVRRHRKELTDAEAAAMIDALTERRVDSWLSFRPIRRSPPDGDAGQDVGDAPVEPARRKRLARRARAG